MVKEAGWKGQMSNRLMHAGWPASLLQLSNQNSGFNYKATWYATPHMAQSEGCSQDPRGPLRVQRIFADTYAGVLLR